MINMHRWRAALPIRVHCKGGAGLLAAIVVLASACGSGAEHNQVTVLAAASLTEPFTAVGDKLAGDGVPVALTFGASSALVEQLRAGARADVLATADTRTMDSAVEAGLVAGEPVVFARNSPVLAVPAGNPGDVTGLADLAQDDLRVALCEPQVPCGAAAEKVLAAAGVEARPDTLEADAQATAGKLALGEVDAALIYRTDVTEAMEVIETPEADGVVNDYLIAVLADAANPEGAEAFVAAVTGEPGRRLLAEAGFRAP